MTSSRGFAALAGSAPAVPDDVVGRFLEQAYGLGGSVTPIAGERDQNLLVDDGSIKRSVKVANAAEELPVLEMQQAALEHVANVDGSIRFPTAVRSLDGVTVTTLNHEGVAHHVRVQSWLEGDPLRASGLARPRDVGAVVGGVQAALTGFFHPMAGRRIAWDVRRAGELNAMVHTVDDDATVKLVTTTLDRETPRLAQLIALPAHVIHNDLNPDNLLVRDGMIDGVIDFGDMVHAPLVVDIAVAAAYQLGTDGAIEEVVAGYQRHRVLSREERSLLVGLVALRLCQTIVIGSWRKNLHTENASYIAQDIDTATNSLATLTASPIGSARLVNRRSGVLAPGLRLSYSEPLHVVEAHGVHLVDDQGRRYLDAYNNVAQVGHGNLEVTNAVAAQLQRLNTNTRYLTEAVVESAERLTALLPAELDTCYFTNSGSEANDLALRMARTVTARQGILITAEAYHGSTDLTMAVSPEEHRYELLAPWIAATAAPGDDALPSFDDAIEQLERSGHRLAAGIIDTVFSSDGIPNRDPDYLDAYASAVRQHGGLYVADEVQAGLGRVGRGFWGFAAGSTTPDIVTLGKPLGNGYPIGAVVTRRDIAERFAARGYFFSTFGGSSAAAAAASTVVRLTVDLRLADRAESVGLQLREFLDQQSRNVAWLGPPRGPGAFIGVPVLDSPKTPASIRASHFVDLLREVGLVIGRTGPEGSVLKIRPPLVFEAGDVAEFSSLFTIALEHA